MKPYRRGQIVFKIGLLVFLTIPPSVCYWKRYQKDIYARGMIKDMERIHAQGRSMHEIPKYTHQEESEKRL